MTIGQRSEQRARAYPGAGSLYWDPLAEACTQSYPAQLYVGRIRYARGGERHRGARTAGDIRVRGGQEPRLSRRRLQRLQATGAVEHIGRGLYRRTDEELVDHDLDRGTAKAHQPTLCLVSALARHKLTDVIPPVHDVAIPRGAWQPVVSAPVQWHKFALATLEVGRTTIRLDDVYAIGLYDAPRTIIDAFPATSCREPRI